MFNKKELELLWRKYNFRPRRRSGQNFLIDKNIGHKIIASLGLTKHDHVLEIGPGFGELTMDLAQSAGILYAVEKDKRICEILNREFRGTPNLKLINADILKIDLAKIFKGRKLTVFGNLPYYITSPVLEYLMERHDILKDIFISVQKEVATRIAAKPGRRDYASLSIFIQFYTRPEILFDIKRSCFFPQPEVDSQFLRLNVLERPSVSVKNEELFFKIVRRAFQQRRKTILNSLSHKGAFEMNKRSLESLLMKAGVDPYARPEKIQIATFARIANSIA